VLTPREQGDVGELSAMYWLASKGAHVAVPVGNNPHWDLMAEIAGRPVRIQVKTSRCFAKGRWDVTLCTRGGNQSWNGLVKHLDASRYDFLFVLVADGRRWFIPSDRVGGGACVRLGGPKYADFEIESGDPIATAPGRRAPLQSSLLTAGGMPERPKGPDCKSGGFAYAGSNPAPPTPALRPNTAPT
jgi:PD-(D/E)XK nuclease superfamily protein